MTGFGSLYYTDCLPGQGLAGGASFQFQAASPGGAVEAMHVVQRSALYEPPAAWMRERRPVADYPRSLAHTAEDGFFVTAAGRYLGQEANGTRQGNQFTHAVVTREAADYGTVRPAQLWGAGWWAEAPAADTVVDGMGPDPEPGPLDPETVRDRVRGTTGGEALLTALVSAVQHVADPARRRTVVLVGGDAEQAACWLAAATLLLPRPQALRVSFKIFVTDPQYGRHDVIALHPEWAGRWADTGADSGLAVFDLDEGRCSAVDPTPSALFWVARFLRDDPYDIVDAVELAGQFAAARSRDEQPGDEQPGDDRPGGVPARAPEPTTADRLVAVVVAAREPLRRHDEVEAVADWLRTAPEETVPIAREPALEALLATVPPAGVLRTTAAAVTERGWDDAAVRRVLDGLLESELEEARQGDGPTALRTALGHRPLLRPGRSEAERTAARALVEKALRAAEPESVPALLTVARRHGVRPEPDGFAESADRFARWWPAQDDDELMPDRWTAPPEIVDRVRTALCTTLLADGPEKDRAIAVVHDRWWRPLLDAAREPTNELDLIVWSAAYPRLEPAAAERLRSRVVEACLGAWAGEAGAGMAWYVLHRFAAPTVAGCRAAVDEIARHGAGMSPEIARGVVDAVDAAPRLTADGMWLIHALHRHGYALPDSLAAQRARDLQVQAVVDDLPQRPAQHDERALARVLDDVPPPHRQVRRNDLVEALLAASRERAAALLCAVDRPAFLELSAGIRERWPHPGSPIDEGRGRAAALTFVVTGASPRTAGQKTDFPVLRAQLGQCVAAIAKEDRHPIFRALPRTSQNAWTQWLRELEPGLLRRLGKVTSSFRAEPGDKEG